MVRENVPMDLMSSAVATREEVGEEEEGELVVRATRGSGSVRMGDSASSLHRGMFTHPSHIKFVALFESFSFKH